MNTAPVLEFLRQALISLTEHCKADGVPRGTLATSFEGDGWRTKFRDVPRWDLAVWRCFSSTKLFELPIAADAASAIWAVGPFPGWKVHLTADKSSEEARPWAIHSLMPVLIDYLQMVGESRFDQTAMREVLERHIANWTAAEQLDEVSVPLFGLHCELDEIRFDEHTSIELFSQEKKEFLWSQWQAELGIVDILPFGQSQYRIRAVADRPRPRLNSSLAPTISRCEHVIIALRLLKDGELFSGGVFIEALPPIIDSPIASRLLVESRHGGIKIGASFELASTELPSLVSLYSHIHSICAEGKAKSLELALRRFVMSQSREREEDSIIDLAISLESSLLADAGSELAFQFATRGTAILADTWNGAECYALLKAFYSARSRIVHSGKTLDELCSSGKLGRRNVHEFVALCRRATREILRFYLDRVTSGVALKDVNREVEDLIVQRVGALNA